MDELIIRVLDGTATEEEANRVADWIADSAENRRRYEAVELVWRETEPEPISGDVDISVVSRIISAAEERESDQRKRRTLRRAAPTRVLRWALPIAAGIGAVSFGVWQWARGLESGSAFAAPASASETFVLDDGSYVRLAAGTSLHRLGSSSERRFELDGRALFAVSHDEANPFVVSAGGVETRVLGTRFDMRALSDGRQQIAVLEGRVEVSNAYGSVELTVGELSVAAADGVPTRSSSENVLALLDWGEGALLFRNTPLARVAFEVGRHFDTRVEVEGEALRNTTISAWYASEPFREVVESLCAATGAECDISDSLAVIR